MTTYQFVGVAVCLTLPPTIAPTPAPPPGDGLANICGVVYDADTLQVIGGATVELLSQGGRVMATTQTGANGAYCFYDQPPGTYFVVGSHPTYTPDMKTVEALPDQTTMVDPYLGPRDPGGGGLPIPTSTPGATVPPPVTPPVQPTPQPTGEPSVGGPGAICVYVHDEARLVPIADAVVEVFDANGNLLATGRTAADGHWCYAPLDPGPVIVVTRADACLGGVLCESRLVMATMFSSKATRVDIGVRCGMAIYLPYNAANSGLEDNLE